MLKLYLVLTLAAVASCKEPAPEFVHELIASPPFGSAHEIWRYRFNGETVYYIPQPYDSPSVLYDSDGKVICSPDGGLRGDGDGRCPTFFKKRRGGRLIWKASEEAPSR